MDMSAYLAAPLQLDKICRVCLSKKSDMKPLYGACLDEILNSFTSIRVKQDDGLPSLLCVQCIWQCSRAHSFKQQCEKSDRILREFIKPEFQAQLQDSVMPVLLKLELDEGSKLDPLTEAEHNFVKDEIKPESVSCTDLDLEPDWNTIEQFEYDEQSLDIVKVEAFPVKEPHLASENHLKYTHVCAVCHKAFTSAQNLKQHAKIHRNETFAPKTNLNNELNHTADTGHNLHNCTNCSRQFVDAASLKIHVRTHASERPYSCDVCHKTFIQVCNLKDHARVHTGEKPYYCSVCEKGFTQSGNLSIHMRTHTGYKPYICPTCGKAYTASTALKVHLRVHTGERPHKCVTCGKCFSRYHSLTEHIRTHTGIKSHFCGVCNKGFNNSGNLAVHMKTHTGDKNHVCNACGHKYTRRARLVKHMKICMKNRVEDESDPLQI